MTLPTSSGNNGLGRSIGDAAGRGAVLVGIAVIIGAFLLWAGFDRSSSDAGTDDAAAVDAGATDDGAATDAADGSTDAAADSGTADTGTDGTPDTGTTDTGAGTSTPTVTTPAVAHPPNEVVVFVANGSGVGGEAGRVADRLTAANYTAEAGNASSQTVEATKVYYRPEYGPDAKLVAEALQAPASVIQQMPAEPEVSPDFAAQAEAANIIVIIGTDGVIAG
ncbi:MAG: LytR C-terminal domain-containing protein [Acidimicrobiia bacterium]|nr:LytR C-terminal domain-containing protein [Acidimicrobiia bacterium]MDH5236189.1 LytR C-terminal domain-containing protein [Acidimicrobiia bacterium]